MKPIDPLDAELDRLQRAPTPRASLRADVLAAIAREPRRARWRDALMALWRDLGGARLAGPAFAAALAAGVGLGWMLDEAPAEGADADDLIELAQLDGRGYEELAP